MPLVKPEINVDFTAENQKLINESNEVIAKVDEVKRATTDANKALLKSAQEADKAAEKSRMSWTDFRSMYQTVLDVVRVGQAVWDEVGQKAVDNAVNVGNLARSLGTTTEEASRLKEVADDVGVGMDALRTSLKLAQKDGLDPNIDGLARMADEYNKLAPGVERTQFLLDRFGKSGDEMGKLLEKGGASIRNMAAAMDEGLIVTQQAYEEARQYQIAVDSLKDSWDALTYKAAPPLIRAVTDVVNMTTAHTRALEIMEEQGLSTYHAVGSLGYVAAMDLARAEQEAAAAALLSAEAATEAGGAFESEAEQAKRLADEAKDTAQAINDMTKANQDYLDKIGTISDRNEDYEKSVREIDQAFADGKITMDERKAKLDELAAKHEETMHRMMLGMLELQLSEGGLDESETNFLLQQGKEWGIYSDKAVAEMAEAQRKVAELTAAYRTVPPLVTTTVRTNYMSYYGQYNSQASQYAHAAGGSFMLPPSVGNEAAQLGGGHTASGGERVTVTPQQEDVIDYKKMARAIRDALAQAG